MPPECARATVRSNAVHASAAVLTRRRRTFVDIGLALAAAETRGARAGIRPQTDRRVVRRLTARRVVQARLRLALVDVGTAFSTSPTNSAVARVRCQPVNARAVIRARIACAFSHIGPTLRSGPARCASARVTSGQNTRVARGLRAGATVQARLQATLVDVDGAVDALPSCRTVARVGIRRNCE